MSPTNLFLGVFYFSRIVYIVSLVNDFFLGNVFFFSLLENAFFSMLDNTLLARDSLDLLDALLSDLDFPDTLNLFAV